MVSIGIDRTVKSHMCDLASLKGCHVPICLAQFESDIHGNDDQGDEEHRSSGSLLVYHFRSPTELGDLWFCNAGSGGSGSGSGGRLTHTMPLSLQQKLFEPTEVMLQRAQNGAVTSISCGTGDGNDCNIGERHSSDQGHDFHALIFTHHLRHQ